MLLIIAAALSTIYPASQFQKRTAERPVVSRDKGAVEILDTAIVRMGGNTALRAVHTARYDFVTQWLSTSFDPRPFTDAPSYEMNTDMRDYSSRTWHNIRKFLGGSTSAGVIDLVVDTVAARYSETPIPSVANAGKTIDNWTALNAAYVDERRELFAFTPDRLVLLLRDAPDLRLHADTTIAGVPHAAVSATIDGYPTTAFFRSSDGYLTFARYHADESNDFGLAPWGPMEVEVWYSVWRYNTDAGIRSPSQWDIVRVGRPYKRMTVRSVSFNAKLPDDSLVLSDSIRAEYLAHARHPMADLPLDRAQLVANGKLAIFATPGAPLAAVKVGNAWLLIEPGNLPLNAEHAATWLSLHDATSILGGGITMTSNPSGGSSWIAKKGLPIYVAPAGAIATSASLRNYGAPTSSAHSVTSGRWISLSKTKSDSVWIEPIDVPNLRNALLLYVPSIRWAYSSAISEPAQLKMVADRLRAREWKVDLIGTARTPAGTAPPQ
jgi:hypothetical protein